MQLADTMFLVAGVAGGLALVVSLVRFLRGRLDLTPFLDTWIAVGFIAVVYFGGKDALGMAIFTYFVIWQLLLRKRVRHWELERAVRQKKTVTLRDVEEGDLPDFFEHQREPEANKMAAFPAREREAFMEHWKKILADDRSIKKTILLNGKVAGNVVCFEQAGRWMIGYWVGKKFWGKGVASRALSRFVSEFTTRPLHAWVAKTNVPSVRVLEKCGFKLTDEGRSAAPTGGEPVEEFLYVLAG